METTDWDAYGTGNYEKCADCMVHSGYEGAGRRRLGPPAADRARGRFRGIKTEGEMAPEISLDNQRPAEYVFSRHVQDSMDRLKHPQRTGKVASAAE